VKFRAGMKARLETLRKTLTVQEFNDASGAVRISDGGKHGPTIMGITSVRVLHEEVADENRHVEIVLNGDTVMLASPVQSYHPMPQTLEKTLWVSASSADQDRPCAAIERKMVQQIIHVNSFHHHLETHNLTDHRPFLAVCDFDKAEIAKLSPRTQIEVSGYNIRVNLPSGESAWLYA
jgi:hypothetical protein